jgi:hypothetical protein
MEQLTQEQIDNAAGLRPSAVPGFIICPSYCQKPEVESDSGSNATRIGQCIHKIFEDYVSIGSKPSVEKVKEYCVQFKVEYDGYDGLARKYNKFYEKWEKSFAKYFDNPEREKFEQYTLESGFPLKGTADLRKVIGNKLFIYDLKTGDTMVLDPMSQIETYCLMNYRKLASYGVERIFGFCGNPTLDYYEIKEYSIQELLDFENMLIEKIPEIGVVFNPGAQCGYCNNLLTCPKHIQVFNALAKMKGGIENISLSNITTESLAGGIPLIKFLKALTDSFDIAKKAIVKNSGGTVRLTDGTELFTRADKNKKFNTGEVLKAINEYRNGSVDKSIVAKNLTINQKGIDAIIGDTADKGKKGVDKNEFKQKLIENEAATTVTLVEKIIQRVVKEDKTNE